MALIRKVRFEYYNVVSKKKLDKALTPDSPFDLLRLIQTAGKMNLSDRTYDYFQEKSRLDKIWYEPKSEYWFLKFLRLRDTNIPAKATVDKEAEPIELGIDEYIGEIVYALYDDKNNILMLQRNRYSLGPSGIEYYLNKLWGIEEEQIFIRPISMINPYDTVKKAHSYRKMSIRFADLPNRKKFVGQHNSTLKKVIDSFGEYEAVNAEITITLGRTKSESLHKETVKETIEEIYKNKGLISSAELSMKTIDDNKTEIIDLFEDRYHDIILFHLERRQSIGLEQAANEMIEKYNDKRGILLSAMN